MDLETKSQGERLASIRIGRQLNQEELANICNLSRATISRLENDQIPLSKKIAHQLALALRVDITLLTKGSRKLPQKKIADLIHFIESSGEYLSIQAIDLLQAQVKYMAIIDHPQITYPRIDNQGFNANWQWGLTELNQIVQSTLPHDLPVGRILIYRQYDVPFGSDVIRYPEVNITSGTGHVPYVTNILEAISYQEGVFKTADFTEFREAKGVFSEGKNPYVTNITFSESENRYVSILISSEREPSVNGFQHLKNIINVFFADKIAKKEGWIESLNDFNTKD